MLPYPSEGLQSQPSEGAIKLVSLFIAQTIANTRSVPLKLNGASNNALKLCVHVNTIASLSLPPLTQAFMN